MFTPPCCPFVDCSAHTRPSPRLFKKEGSYAPRCRSHRVPRFRCHSCERRFSRQSFRADRGQKKPHLNAAFLQLMVNCVGQRQAARILRVAR
ncbi:MAG TPA: hypothetical protein VJS92_04410, partial [Candidatus Polarisedimenticolaceae bacterium]|nr:hypothetical protein [Candidatus Polarisedimenticolaceae bacterium]